MATVFPEFTLNDGRKIPSIAFGTWTSGDRAAGEVLTAVDKFDFYHIDTAQVYRNENGVGKAVKESKVDRDSLWITSKFSGLKSFDDSLSDSLSFIGTDHLDLYLIHHPRVAAREGGIQAAWKKMEEAQAAGKSKSIGVSNFGISDLEELFKTSTVKPAVNQILLHPYVYAQQKPLLEYLAKHKIIAEAYSALNPITRIPRGGPLDAVLAKLTKKHDASEDQILLAWVKAKGAVIVTTSSKESRLAGYIKVNDINLTEEDVAAIDEAGSKGWPLQNKLECEPSSCLLLRRR
ncbi:Aldo/keto reductase [Atractiella rhizophila]|nr:Aldo/keto reductase [Atractiella rhizophila]